MPAQPARAGGRVATQRGDDQPTAIDLQQFDSPTNESLTTTTPEGFALPAIDSAALRAEDLFNDEDNNLAAADNAPTVAQPKQERKATEFDVTTNPIAAPLPAVIPTEPVVRFTKQVTAPPPVDGTRATGTLSAVTAAAAREPTAVPIPPRTLTGQLRAPTLSDTSRTTGAHRNKPLSQGMTIKRSSKRVYVFAAIGAIVAGGAAAAMMMMASKHGAETTHVTAPSATIAATITTGTIKVVTEPADADITIEGMPAHTGSPWTVDLPAGIHQIEIHRPGYKTWLTSIELSATETQPVHVVLQPLSDAAAGADATLTISTNPPGLEAIVDGNLLAEKTPTKLSVKVGPHTIAVRRNGAEVWHHAFTAEASSDYEFNPAFKTDAPKPDAPKGDMPKTDAPKTDAPKGDTPKAPAAATSTPAASSSTPAPAPGPANAAAPGTAKPPASTTPASPSPTNSAPTSAKPPAATTPKPPTNTTNATAPGASAESPKTPIEATKAPSETTKAPAETKAAETKSPVETKSPAETSKTPAQTPPAP